MRKPSIWTVARAWPDAVLPSSFLASLFGGASDFALQFLFDERASVNEIVLYRKLLDFGVCDSVFSALEESEGSVRMSFGSVWERNGESV